MKTAMIEVLITFLVGISVYQGFGEPIRDSPQGPKQFGTLTRGSVHGNHPQELFERDILLTPEQTDYILSPKEKDKKSLIVNRYRWPTKTVNGENIVEVPYVFDSGVSLSVRKLYEEGVKKFNRLTCVRFIPRTSQKDYLKILRGAGCNSYVGHVGGEQPVNLGSGCESVGHVIHENMHALGFFHEQSRPDRDEFVRINWDNILPDATDEFKKYNVGEGITGGELVKYPYDLHSIMAYEKIAFSKNNKPTVEDKQNPSAKIGQLKDFSIGDLFKINSMYNCADKYLNAKNYKISVYTSSSLFSGTNARVFLKIFGPKADSGEIELKSGAFEAGE
uniref:Metalloendopeptidase n=1 Tax=Pachycerianthus maua TaxID=2736681 RepID=A0A7G7WYU0_9CNID|nr:toxin candidate TRINITY_DN38778_c2_g4_i1 [Pachycerianthus maua]